jgi:steroid delta-isomerase-like uncharacterized protein
MWVLSRSPEETARGVFAAIADRDLPAIAGYLAGDDVQVFVPVGRFEGRDAIVAFFAQLFAAFPDLVTIVEDVRVSGAYVAVRWRLRGTFTGNTFQGIAATGRRLEIEGVDAFVEVRDGLIVRNTIFYDGAAFLRGAGVLPERGSGAEAALLTLFNTWTWVRRKLLDRIPL